ncbi:MAG: hypothetical protein KBC64_03645 [Simkaniaceae bacterium]|nr:hypothetical protein [Simkaniaceae bacterium]
MTNLLNLTPWEEVSDPIHLFSRFLLRRNIARHLFPHKLSSNDLSHLCSMIPHAEPLQTLSPAERDQLADVFQVPQGLQNIQVGQGFICEYPMLTLINDKNHLSFYAIAPASLWSERKKELLDREKQLSTLFPFAYHPKFGFLTSHIDECGSGFTYTVDLHLPLLNRLGHLEAALQEELESDVILSSPPGDFISISNRSSLGYTEEHTLHMVNASLHHLKRAEMSLREHIGEHKEIKDLMARAFGLLQHSCQLELREAIDALSLLMLGVQLGVFTGMSPKELFALTFLAKREFLQPDSQEDLLEKRALFFKTKLSLLRPLI